MTSKEALRKLNFECIRSNGIDDEYSKELKIVEKDLEILDILKKHYDNNSLIISLDNFISLHIYKDDKDFNKIKEWLENE
ncbi:MAG: hypothetical protein PUK09_05855 [Bacilli bacterium]|nr:hypothetical protein [Bacilli bacterium]